MRINRYIATMGVCSRRHADRLIEAGRVTVNGETARLGQKIKDGDRISIDGKPLRGDIARERVVLAYHKPAGILCTSNRSRPNNIIDAVRYPRRVFTVGRLDQDSRGLILLTDDGELAYHLTRTREGHEKEYVVTVDRPFDDAFLAAMTSGVDILETTTLPCDVRPVGPETFRIVLTQGLNRQIRRMCDALGYTVIDLMRVRFANIRLGDLPEGVWRELTDEERDELDRRIGRTP